MSQSVGAAFLILSLAAVGPAFSQAPLVSQATAKKLGATTSFTAGEVAQGMRYLGMAGFNTEQILARIIRVVGLV